MRLATGRDEDHHMHSSDFSDGEVTVEWISYLAGVLGLKKITITDHSQEVLDLYRRMNGRIMPQRDRRTITNWQNPHNNGVEVEFGLEADIIDEHGNVCTFMGEEDQGEGNLILSAHGLVYRGDSAKITQAYTKAIERFHDRIRAIGHPTSRRDFSREVDMVRLCHVARDYGIPLEINGKDFSNGNMDYKALDIMLRNADQVMVNSDAHSVYHLRYAKRVAYDFLRTRT